MIDKYQNIQLAHFMVETQPFFIAEIQIRNIFCSITDEIGKLTLAKNMARKQLKYCLNI